MGELSELELLAYLTRCLAAGDLASCVVAVQELERRKQAGELQLAPDGEDEPYFWERGKCL